MITKEGPFDTPRKLNNSRRAARTCLRVAKTLFAGIGYHSRPAFLVIGCQKCGTTALHSYLDDHPDILSSKTKEIGYFHRDACYLARGSKWYHSHFPLPCFVPRNALTFEATPEYIYYPNVAERIHDYDPNLKLIVLLRDPVSRAYSAWNMYRKWYNNGLITLRRRWTRIDEPVRKAFADYFSVDRFHTFSESIDLEIQAMAGRTGPLEPSVVRRGLYAEQLERYLDLFPNHQLLVLDSADLRQRLPETLTRVVEFLGLREHDWQKLDNKRSASNANYRELKSQYESPISVECRRRLEGFFRPHNKRLYDLLGRDFSW